MKRRIFWSVFFTVFVRLQIYEAIAAIFWQSASYVIFVDDHPFNINRTATSLCLRYKP